MSEYKEFQGKSLDDAIDAACRHFDLKRDKLEIEILSGGSTGIFGLVGKKKATIKARPRGAKIDLGRSETQPEAAPKGESRPRGRKPRPEARGDAPAERQTERQPAPETGSSAPAEVAEAAPAEGAPAAETAPEAGNGRESRSRGRRGRGRGRGRGNGQSAQDGEQNGEQDAAPAREGADDREQAEGDRRPARRERSLPAVQNGSPRLPAKRPEDDLPDDDFDSADDSGHPDLDLSSLDADKLKATVIEAVTKLLSGIVETPKLEVTIETDRVNVFIDEEDYSGLIIGREGQTLSSLQYLSNRIVSRLMDANVRVQLDTGDYRERQDEKLRQVARHLADKAMNQGRTQSTKPLSSYHRRVVHLTLQDDENVFTRSKGEGPLKRVLIVPKRRGGAAPRNGRQA